MSITRRLNFSIGRGWMIFILAVATIIALSYWIGPLKPVPPRLQLLAVDGPIAVDVIQPRAQRIGDDVRFVIPVAVRNLGTRPARARRLSLSVPGFYHVATSRGALTSEVSAGVPLRRYVIDLPSPLIRPGQATEALPGLDTLFIIPDLPSYYCTLTGLDVPEFVPAPRYSAETLSDVRLFYSFATGAGERSTGLLTVKLDPALLDITPAPMPPPFRTVFEDPEARVPDMGALRFAGTRTAYCGDPEQPIELFSVLWETLSGGRFFVIYVHGQPRKHLFDLNRDGVVELEVWDGDADGNFEARRDARFAVPQFLLPRPNRLALLSAPDSTPPDSAWLDLFLNVAAGPWRFARPPTTPRLATDSARALLARDTAGVTPPDSAFLRLFHDVAAGPFRFSRPAVAAGQAQPAAEPAPAAPPATPGAQGVTPPPAAAPPQPARPAPAVPADSPRVEPEPDPPSEEPSEDPPAPPRPRREPLGVPVDTARVR